MAGRDPRVTTTAPVQPYTQQGFGGYEQSAQAEQQGPMFLMSGGLDTIAPPSPHQQRVWDDSNVEVFWGIQVRADHIFSVAGDLGDYRGPATAWFRDQLMCDDTAAAWFDEACLLCDDPDWDVRYKP